MGQRFSGESDYEAPAGIVSKVLPYLGEHHGDALVAADLVIARSVRAPLRS